MNKCPYDEGDAPWHICNLYEHNANNNAFYISFNLVFLNLIPLEDTIF